MLKKTLIRAGLGFLLGMVAGNLIAVLISGFSSEFVIPVTEQLLSIAGGNNGAAVLLQTLFSGVYGAVCFAGITFYELERWPLALATAAHCLLIIVPFIPVAHLLGWETGVIDTLIMAGFQLVAFFIVWLIMNAIYKAQVRKLNAMQKQFSEKENKNK